METIKTRSKTQKSFPHGLENGSLTLSVFHRSHRFYCYCEDSLCRGIRSQNMMVDSTATTNNDRKTERKMQ